MSWLAKSFANLIATEDDDDGGDGVEHRGDGGKRTPGDAAEVLSPAAESNEEDGSGEADLGRGVKEDLSELSKTLTRQFWGVASFLAPPPASSPSPSSPSSADGDASHDLPHPSVSPDSADSPKIGGIRSDFAEIGGRFRSGISKLSSAKAVSEISKIASSFLQLTSDGEEEEMEDEHELEKKLGSRGIAAIGVTDEVLTFAQNISMHPETWLDFPLFSDDDATDGTGSLITDFDMSDAQQEHALAVERLVPRLAALRIELCPGHISEGCFWKIYFVLLHPRLNKNDAELLSTPQIVEARALLLQDLQSRTKSPSGDWSSSSRKKEDAPPFEGDDSSADLETEKHTVAAAEVRVVDKAVIEEDAPVYRRKEALPAMDVPPAAPLEKFEDNGDEWLEDESPAGIGGAKISSVAIADDEDVSFSDLEEEDEKTQAAAAPPPPTSSNAGKPIAAKAPEEANEWSDLEDLDVV